MFIFSGFSKQHFRFANLDGVIDDALDQDPGRAKWSSKPRKGKLVRLPQEIDIASDTDGLGLV